MTSRAVSGGEVILAGASRRAAQLATPSRPKTVWIGDRNGPLLAASSGLAFPLDSPPWKSGSTLTSSAYTDSACTNAPGRALPRSLSLRISSENDGGGLYGIQEVDGSILLSSTIDLKRVRDQLWFLFHFVEFVAKFVLAGFQGNPDSF